MNGRAWRIFLAIIFPPLAVLDNGCGTIFVVSLLTLTLWVPGVIAAILIVLADKPEERRRFVRIGNNWSQEDEEKAKGAYIRLVDGKIANVVEDDHAPLENFPEKRKND
jgi:uncharacterized membrane protein YqaE (UPF0057 family)